MTFPIAASTVTSFHEFGHTSRMGSMGDTPIYIPLSGGKNNYFTQWATHIFHEYFTFPFIAPFTAAVKPNTKDITHITQHYDHLKEYVNL